MRSPRPASEREYCGEVVDLFCGVGALSYGLKRAGLKILAGYDTDANCKFAFEKNNGADFIRQDVARLTAQEINEHYSGELPTVLAGCAPCQPFSSYKQRYDEDPQWGLVTDFARLAAEVMPDFVTMENVPALLRYKNGRVFRRFCAILEEAGYAVKWSVAKCEEFRVPQKRRRLVVLASRDFAPGELRKSRLATKTVREAIEGLPPLQAGHGDPKDPLHVSSSLSALNMQRIRASKPGGSWQDWPAALRAPCHKRKTGKSYPGVYGRMAWDEPSPTITTQCFGFGSGRFGHPKQNRAISLREAAILQSFPKSYSFLPRNASVSIKEVGRWIGNAVPVNLAEAIGRTIVRSIRMEM